MSLVGIGTTLINLYMPISLLGISYNETDSATQVKTAKSNSLTSFFGYGLNLRYNILHKLAIAAHYESVPGVQGKTTLLQGYGVSGIYSFYGGAAVIQDNSIYTSVVAPTLNLYTGLGIVKRDFDLRDGKGGTIDDAVDKGYSKVGDFVGASVLIGADYTILSPQFKLTSEVSYLVPLSVSTSIVFTLINARIGVGYQL